MAALLKPGVVLREKWRLDKFLGRGGMSAVYAATHRNGMRGAIKVLHRELNENEIIKKRFMREGYVANKLDHPGAVRVLDDDVTEDGLVFLVMELLEGITLKQRWVEADRKLGIPFVIEVVDQVLDVLESAHRHKIVHRDLKPDNIFILENGTAKVLDFGIARLADAAPGAADATNSAAMMGTPAFMPPEQALAHWHRVDGRTDLFAIAATAYTVLSGRLIHGGSTIPELLISAATKQVESLRAVLPEADENVAAVLDRALRFDIEERWPDARSMRLALLQAKTRSLGNRTVQMPLKTAVIPIAQPMKPSASPPPNPAPVAAPPSFPFADALDTVVPTTTPMDSSSDPTMVTPPATVKDEAARAPAPTERVGPVRAAHPKTMQSEVGALAPHEATPVRLQEPIRVENVARLSQSRSQLATPTAERKSGSVTRWGIVLVVLIIGVAAALVVKFVTPPSGVKSERSPSSSAPSVSSAAAATEEVRADALPSTLPIDPTAPTPSSSSSAQLPSSPSTSASSKALPKPTVRAPPRPCRQFSEFDPTRCVVP